MDLLTGVPPMPKRGDHVDGNPHTPPAPPDPVDVDATGGMPWWHGRTFYACECGARDERTRNHRDHPATLPCWGDKCDGIMNQWTPPGVERDRMRYG